MFIFADRHHISYSLCILACDLPTTYFHFRMNAKAKICQKWLESVIISHDPVPDSRVHLEMNRCLGIECQWTTSVYNLRMLWDVAMCLLKCSAWAIAGILLRGCQGVLGVFQKVGYLPKSLKWFRSLCFFFHQFFICQV